MISRLIVGFLAIAAYSSAHGLTYQKAFQLISEQGEALNYSSHNHGALCEVLAVAKMEEVYPDAVIESGIKYGPRNGNVMGELDIVIMRDEQATMVIEVKCMKRFSSAASKAEGQLRRFSKVAGRCDFEYWDSYKNYDCEEFQNSEKTYHKMSYEDAGSYGFDLSFDLRRSEILRLIDDLSSRY